MVFEDEQSVDIEHMLDQVYNSHDKYTKNLLACVIKYSCDKIQSCPSKMCTGKKMNLIKNRYVCSNCGDHVRPKEVSFVNLVVGNEERNLSFSIFDKLADRFIKSYQKGDRLFYFRVQGTLKNKNGVNFHNLMLAAF